MATLTVQERNERIMAIRISIGFNFDKIHKEANSTIKLDKILTLKDETISKLVRLSTFAECKHTRSELIKLAQKLSRPCRISAYSEMKQDFIMMKL